MWQSSGTPLRVQTAILRCVRAAKEEKVPKPHLGKNVFPNNVSSHVEFLVMSRYAQRTWGSVAMMSLA